MHPVSRLERKFRSVPHVSVSGFRLRVREYNMCGRGWRGEGLISSPFISCTINSGESGGPSNTKIYKVCDVIFRGGRGYPSLDIEKGGKNPSLFSPRAPGILIYLMLHFQSENMENMDWTLDGSRIIILREQLSNYSHV